MKLFLYIFLIFGPLANSPNEVIAPVSAVTSDIKGNPQDVRMTDPSR